MKTSTLLLALGLLAGSAWAQPRLTVHATPADALIFVDREMRGQGAVDLTDLTPGQHLVRVSAGEDWETYQTQIDLSSSQPTDLRIELKPGGAKWLRSGHMALERGDYTEAIRCFGRAAKARPIRAAWWSGVSRWKAGQPVAAIQDFRRYAQFQPKVPELNWILGTLHEQTRQFGPAFTAYKAAALAQPELAHALDKLPPATEQSIVQLQNQSGAANHLRLGQLLMLKGKMKEACAEARLALGDKAKSWQRQDWTRWDPPLPPGPEVLVAPPEDQPNPVP